MDTTQNPTPSPAPADSGIGWGALLGGIVAAALIAGGIYYLFLAPTPAAPIPGYNTDGNKADAQVDSIESDLNASGGADSSADLDSLDNSL